MTAIHSMHVAHRPAPTTDPMLDALYGRLHELRESLIRYRALERAVEELRTREREHATTGHQGAAWAAERARSRVDQLLAQQKGPF